jgi:hypothetical protein
MQHPLALSTIVPAERAVQKQSILAEPEVVGKVD